MMLDATAGNRMMWPNKNPPNTVFMDKEPHLKIPPDIVGIWERLPFRDDVFDCVLFDPPHMEYPSKNSIHADPKASKGSWWGYYPGSRRGERFFPQLYKALKEFNRVSERLCFKWCDSRIPLHNLLPFFRNIWSQVYQKSRKTRSGLGKNTVYWITFVRSLATRVKTDG